MSDSKAAAEAAFALSVFTFSWGFQSNSLKGQLSNLSVWSSSSLSFFLQMSSEKRSQFTF